MTVDDRPLTGPKLAAVLALASGADHTDAARAAGVTPRTLRRWRADPEFLAAITDATAGTITAAREALARSATSAVTVLLAIARDTTQPAAARVTAARTLLGLALEQDLAARLDGIERALEAVA